MFITGEFHHINTSFNNVKLKILNEDDESIYAKTNGFKHYRINGSSTTNTYSDGIYNYEVFSINNKTLDFNLIVRPIGESTTYFKVYLEFSNQNTSSVYGNIKILY